LRNSIFAAPVILFSIFAIFHSQAGAESVVFQLKSGMPPVTSLLKAGNKISGHKEIVERLQSRAAISQAGFLGKLHSYESAGKVSSYKSLWVANVVIVDAPADIINELALDPDVANVYEDMPVSLVEPVETGTADITSVGHEGGLDVIGATEVWSMGLDGAGSLVCNFDTGVNGNHPALINKYRGNNGGSSSESWFDPYTNTQYPTDLHGHGTHTMGTMLGSEAGDTIGVAPGAQWIAAAVVDRGGGIQRTISDILMAFQWAIDPDGNPNTTDDVPDVVNNSWGIPLGYYPACNETFWQAIDNLEAAGVVCLFAAGNEGPYSSTIRTPADRITTSFNSFSVGAVNGYLPDLPVASFSSRGPSGCDGITIKPEVTAPGVSIRSASRTGTYITMSGTSMATPHVAGAVAILRQFNPDATPQQIKQALMYSARDLGIEGEDNDYGWGVIDIRRALNYMPPPTGIFPAVLGSIVSGDGVADPGESIGLQVMVENLGRPGNNISVNLSSDNPDVVITLPNVTLSQFDHNDTVSVGPFEMNLGNNIQIGEYIPFDLTFTFSGGSRHASFYLIAGGGADPGVATHVNDQLVFSFSNIGQFGLGPGSINPLGGEGFMFPPGGPDFLKGGALLLATDRYHVSDGAMSADPLIADNDFSPLAGGFPRLLEPGDYSDQDGFSAYSDSAAEAPLGLNINQRSFCWTGPSSTPFVITEFTVQNYSLANIDSLYIGLFCDWDLPLSSGSDDIVDYVDYESLGYVQDLSTGVCVGLKTITSNASSYAAIDNAAVLANGFTELEKFNSMTAGFANVSYSTPGNYSHLITVGPFSLPIGDSETAAFSFVAGNNVNELIANAQLSFAMYPGLTNAAGEGNTIPDRFELISNYPNPFNGGTVISLARTVDPDEEIEIFDITGRLVRSLPIGGSKLVNWDGTDRNGHDVAAGVYFAKLSRTESTPRKMIYLK